MLVQAAALAGCGNVEEPVTTETTLCGKFNFAVAGKADASGARVAFYAASVRLGGLDFADERFHHSSKFYLDGQTFVLDGLQGYQHRQGDAPLTLQVRAYSTVRNTRSVQSVPCTMPGSAAAFDNVKASMSQAWKTHVEHESPEYERQRSAAK